MKRLILLALLTSCASQVIVPTPKAPKAPVAVAKVREAITTIVSESECSKRYWRPNRGVAPLAYIQGVALMYAKQVCGQGTDFIKSDKIKSTWHYQDKNIKHDDSLEFYGIEGNEGNTYTMLIGLGMMESSGRYGAGRDLSQDYTKSNSAEAGLFQMSYNAKLFHKELDPLYKEFKNGVRDCELDAFKDSKSSKVKSHEGQDFGTGEGAAWQKLMKVCPAASTTWAAILIRARMAHFGPLKRKSVEFIPVCREMLSKVESVVKNNCGGL